MKNVTNTVEVAEELSTKEDENIMQVLHRDHMKVNELFFEYSQTKEDSRKKEIVEQITKELSLHAKVEEEVVYPEVRNGNEEVEDMMDEADTEHHIIKFMLAELSGMEPEDSHYDSKVTVLCEVVKHHVEEEENDVFEKLKSSGKDLQELGRKFAARKADLAQKPLPEESFPVVGTKANSGKSK